MSAPLVALPPQETLSPEQAIQKSLTHWVWTPYVKINNMQAWGINSLLGYRGQAWTEFERCRVYPLGNMTSKTKDRQAAEEAFQASYAVNSESIPDKEHVKYAQEQANEMGETYGQDHGLRVLTPFIGVDDFDRVGRIVEVVQPRAFKIHEMAFEFTEGAQARIGKSSLSGEDKATAEKLATIMHGGYGRAFVKASDEYERLISSMSDKSVGQPGISNPTPFHVWICEQLNKPVPARIDRSNSSQSGTDSGLIKALLDRDSERERQLQEIKAGMSKPGRKPKEVEQTA
jgi:hypothetical protein